MKELSDDIEKGFRTRSGRMKTKMTLAIFARAILVQNESSNCSLLKKESRRISEKLRSKGIRY